MSHKKSIIDHSIEQHMHIISWIYHGAFNSSWIEQWIEIILCLVKLCMPWFWIRNICGNNYNLRNKVLERYMLIKLIILCLLIIWYPSAPQLSVVVALYFLIDIIQHFLGLIFLSNVYTSMPSLKKNFAHLGINVLEIVWWFAVLYLYSGAIGSWWVAIHDAVSSLYFSMVTFATVGYGDIWPINTLWKIMVACQISVSFLFITIICSSFVSDITIKEN